MGYETKEGFGALFNNATNKKSDKHPDYTGNVMLDGKLRSIGAWITESKSGNKYMSLKFSDFKPKSDETREYTTTAPESTEIPF